MSPSTVRNVGASALLILLLTGWPSLSFAQEGPAQIVISQVYAGGAEETSTYRSDFIEIFNRGGESSPMNGWTLEYAPASTLLFEEIEVLGWTLRPGQYNLILLHTTGLGGLLLPLHDGLAFTDLEPEGGQVRLRDALGNIVDQVSYGDVPPVEGDPAPPLDRNTAIHRVGNGCQDSDNNAADFGAGAPFPRNQSFEFTSCAVWLDGATRRWPKIGSITNAASNLGGPIAPGQVMTIRGETLGPDQPVAAHIISGRYLPQALAGVRVLIDKGTHHSVDDAQAPLLSVSGSQVSFVVPNSVANWDEVSVRVEYLTRRSQRIKLQVADTAPAIFTSDFTGKGQAVALNQNGTINSAANPAAKGSVVTLYLTGAGATDPALPDGIFAGSEPAPLTQEVTGSVGGDAAEVISAGAAYGMVNGVAAVKLRLAADIGASGDAPVSVSVGGTATQPGVTINVAGESATQIPADLEDRMQALMSDAVVPALPELPNDRVGLPDDWLGLLSWNVNAAAGPLGDPRSLMLETALRSIYSGTYDLLAAQGVPNGAQQNRLREALPGGAGLWGSLFFDTTSALDNANWHRPATVKTSGGFVMGTLPQSEFGPLMHDASQAVHPPVVGHYLAGDFDFTLINVHHFYTNGNFARATAEFGRVLDYLEWYFNQPDHDPDVLVCGDFGIPSALSGQTAGGATLDSLLEADARFSYGERRLVVLGHENTERQTHGDAVRNTDHCLCSIDALEELIQVKRVSPTLLTDHPADPAQWLTSDHFPVAAFFRTSGEGVERDGSKLIRLP